LDAECAEDFVQRLNQLLDESNCVFSSRLLERVLSIPAVDILTSSELLAVLCRAVIAQDALAEEEHVLDLSATSGLIEVCWLAIQGSAPGDRFSMCLNTLTRLNRVGDVQDRLESLDPVRVLRALDDRGRARFVEMISDRGPRYRQAIAEVATELDDCELLGLLPSYMSAIFAVARSRGKLGKSDAWWRLVRALAESGRNVVMLYEPSELLSELRASGPRRCEALRLMRAEALSLHRWDPDGLAEAAWIMAEVAADGSWVERRMAFLAEVALARVTPRSQLADLWRAREAVAHAAASNLVALFDSFEERLPNTRSDLIAIVEAAGGLPSCADPFQDLAARLSFER
jgi:hypothetical protein